MQLNDRQQQVLELLNIRDRFGATYTQGLANILKCDTLSLSSTLLALERRGLAGYIPPRDQWSSRNWFITKKGQQVLKETDNATS